MSAAQNNPKLYSCGHPRPQGPIRTLIAHTKPLLCPHAQPEPAVQSTSSPLSAAVAPTPTTHAVIFHNPFNNPITSTSTSSSTTSSTHSSRRNSLSREREDLSPEERVAAGMEYMIAFLASRDRPSSSSSFASSSSSATATAGTSSSSSSSRASSTALAPAPERQMARRAAVGAA